MVLSDLLGIQPQEDNPPTQPVVPLDLYKTDKENAIIGQHISSQPHQSLRKGRFDGIGANYSPEEFEAVTRTFPNAEEFNWRTEQGVKQAQDWIISHLPANYQYANMIPAGGFADAYTMHALRTIGQGLGQQPSQQPATEAGSATQATQQAPQPPDFSKYEKAMNEGYNPLFALLDQGKPKDNDRLKKAAWAAALAEAFRNVGDAVYGDYAPITDHRGDSQVPMITERIQHEKDKQDAYAAQEKQQRLNLMLDRLKEGKADDRARFQNALQLYRSQRDDFNTDRSFAEGRRQFDTRAAQQKEDALWDKQKFEATQRQQRELAEKGEKAAAARLQKQIDAQRELQKEAIEAGKYQNRQGGQKLNNVPRTPSGAVNWDALDESQIPDGVVSTVLQRYNHEKAVLLAKKNKTPQEKELLNQMMLYEGTMKQKGKTGDQVMAKQYISRYFSDIDQDGNLVPRGEAEAGKRYMFNGNPTQQAVTQQAQTEDNEIEF